MTTRRHLRALLSIYLLLPLFLAVPLAAQPVTQQKVAPDCGPYNFVASASGVIAGAAGLIDNIDNGLMCFNWTVSYSSTGFSGVSVSFQSAGDNMSGGTPVHAPGTWGTFAGTLISGANPSSSTTVQTSSFLGYYPFVRINILSVTGSGLITGQVYGYRSSARFGIAYTLSWQLITTAVWASMTPTLWGEIVP